MSVWIKKYSSSEWRQRRLLAAVQLLVMTFLVSAPVAAAQSCGLPTGNVTAALSDAQMSWTFNGTEIDTVTVLGEPLTFKITVMSNGLQNRGCGHVFSARTKMRRVKVR